MSSDFGKGGAPQRLLPNYRTILEAIRDVPAGTHLTAHDVYARARATRPRLGFATVHRGLTRLSELGFVLKVDVPGAASAFYEQAVSPHAHFRCTRCGSIRDIDFAVPPEVLAALAERHGLEIGAESTTFAGRCADCAASAPSRNS
jgi:Fe2+ or Zn2+ uptake regulation protein